LTCAWYFITAQKKKLPERIFSIFSSIVITSEKKNNYGPTNAIDPDAESDTIV